MSLRSLWTREAELAYIGLFDYLEGEWGTHVADAFENEVAHTIGLLEVFPDAGILELREEGIRSIPVARQVRLFYRHTGELLIVLVFIDTRTERFQRMRWARP